MLVQFGEARESKILGGQQDFVPNLKLHHPMVLVIISLLGLVCMLYSSLGNSNQLLHPNNKLGTSLTLNLHINHNVSGFIQLLTKNNFSWGKLCT